MNIYETLVSQLKKEPNFVSDNGELKKWVVSDKARNYDETILSLLLEKNELRQKFFRVVNGTTIFLLEEFLLFIEQKNYLNDSYTQYKNKIGLTIGGRLLNQHNEVELVWPYKDCILEGGQTREDQKRPEIFFNQTLAQDEITQLLDPKVLTNYKRYGNFDDDEIFHRDATLNEKRGLPKDTITDNIVIKGNNLLALYSLKKEFSGKVKLIYIDPPYNTKSDANTFGYNNSFNHSSWLTFMKNRLSVAKELLKDDGIIAITIDDEEFAYLKIICDAVFGINNFIGNIIVQIKPSGRTNDAFLATSHEFVLLYSKNKTIAEINFFPLSEEQKKQYKEGEGEQIYKWRDFLRTGGYSTPEERPNSYYPIYYNSEMDKISLEPFLGSIEILPIDSSQKKRVWRKTRESFLRHLNNNEIKVELRNGNYKVLIIDKVKSGVRPKSIWVDSKYDAASYGTKYLKKLFNGEKVFSFPKSIYAVRDVIYLFTNPEEGDIVLDFFAGSGTTGQAVLDLNKEDDGDRRFILCEQMNYIEDVTVERIEKVIENNQFGNFIYLELKKYNQTFIERIEEAKDSEALLQIWKQIKEKSFIAYNIDIKTQDANIEEFKKLDLEQQKQLLCEILDKNQLYVNVSDMNDSRFETTDEERNVTNAFYSKN